MCIQSTRPCPPRSSTPPRSCRYGLKATDYPTTTNQPPQSNHLKTPMPQPTPHRPRCWAAGRTYPWRSGRPRATTWPRCCWRRRRTGTPTLCGRRFCRYVNGCVDGWVDMWGCVIGPLAHVLNTNERYTNKHTHTQYIDVRGAVEAGVGGGGERGEAGVLLPDPDAGAAGRSRGASRCSVLGRVHGGFVSISISTVARGGVVAFGTYAPSVL